MTDGGGIRIHLPLSDVRNAIWYRRALQSRSFSPDKPAAHSLHYHMEFDLSFQQRVRPPVCLLRASNQYSIAVVICLAPVVPKPYFFFFDSPLASIFRVSPANTCPYSFTRSGSIRYIHLCTTEKSAIDSNPSLQTHLVQEHEEYKVIAEAG
jgi:hypothetical protein